MVCRRLRCILIVVIKQIKNISLSNRTNIILVLFFLFSFLNGSAQQCIDTAATQKTKNLYRSLAELQKNYTLFGHQDDLAYGVGWKKVENNSDIKLVTNSYPAVFGWDISGIEYEKDNNIDDVPFSDMVRYIKHGYKMGSVITISWHANNPLTGKNAWDTTHGTVSSILPGGINHDKYITWLNRVSTFLLELKDDNGEPIPVLFRPFHEMTGNWFWWCKNACTPEEFISLWRFTVSYLKNEKNLHQLIYVYNTAEFNSAADFLKRYPGNNYADVLSFDQYQFDGKDGNAAFQSSLNKRLAILNLLANENNKLAALAETGFESIPDSVWWTKTMWPLLKKSNLSYVLVWRNHGFMPSTGKMHYYAPFPGQASANDFIKFCSYDKIMLNTKLKKFHIYE